MLNIFAGYMCPDEAHEGKIMNILLFFCIVLGVFIFLWAKRLKRPENRILFYILSVVSPLVLLYVGGWSLC